MLKRREDRLKRKEDKREATRREEKVKRKEDRKEMKEKNR